MKTAALFKNPRIRLGIATLVVLVGFYIHHRIARLDPEVFPLNSVRSLQGLTLYELENYRGAAIAYRAHYRDVYYVHSGDEQLSLLLDNDYEKAQDLAKTVLEKDPLDIHSLLTMGEVALAENRLDDALASLSIILKHEIDQFDALLLSSVIHARNDQFGEAIHNINLALRHGRVHTRVTSFLIALDLLGKLHELPPQKQPSCLMAQYHRFLRIFDPTNAIAVRRFAEKAIENGDHPADAYLSLGILHSKKWQTEEALQAFLKAADENPKHAEALRWASTTYGTRGDITNAYKQMRAAHEAAPNDPFYANRLADILTDNLGDYHQALSVTVNSLKVSPASSDSYQRLGEIYNLLGNYDASIQSYRSAIRLNGNNFMAYLGLGSSLRQFGNAEEAIRIYKNAISMRPSSPDPHIGLAHIYHELARYDDAITAYERGIDLGRRDTVQLIALCGMYFESSRFEKAVDCFKQALRQKPNDATARKRLADAEKNLELARAINLKAK